MFPVMPNKHSDYCHAFFLRTSPPIFAHFSVRRMLSFSLVVGTEYTQKLSCNKRLAEMKSVCMSDDPGYSQKFNKSKATSIQA